MNNLGRVLAVELCNMDLRKSNIEQSMDTIFKIISNYAPSYKNKRDLRDFCYLVRVEYLKWEIDYDTKDLALKMVDFFDTILGRNWDAKRRLCQVICFCFNSDFMVLASAGSPIMNTFHSWFCYLGTNGAKHIKAMTEKVTLIKRQSARRRGVLDIVDALLVTFSVYTPVSAILMFYLSQKLILIISLIGGMLLFDALLLFWHIKLKAKIILPDDINYRVNEMYDAFKAED